MQCMSVSEILSSAKLSTREMEVFFPMQGSDLTLRSSVLAIWIDVKNLFKCPGVCNIHQYTDNTDSIKSNQEVYSLYILTGLSLLKYLLLLDLKYITASEDHSVTGCILYTHSLSLSLSQVALHYVKRRMTLKTGEGDFSVSHPSSQEVLRAGRRGQWGWHPSSSTEELWVREA